ncbi:GNAT family N-acetyltransferase [Methanobacterium alcaliphilum]|uniref:GNAT family N-acetyltransferase n=1 Tax=Methanobacterium alcaliphilum TaxID=392018 RepID=UPI002009EB56|nr:GNAT family N-acetyltransferase [Methanobacterium alcaliphilum]MCK9151738.1 GNAT family N-acetyltransferase [Methanobacterium alcaliphilum]
MTLKIEIEEINEIDENIYELLLLGDSSKEMLEDYIHRSRKYVAKLNKEVVGIIVATPTRPLTLEILNISVKEEFQKQGIGTQLIKYVISLAHKWKKKVIEIGTGNCGINQIALYQKCGFRIVAIEPNYFTKYYKEFYKEEILENNIQCKDVIRLKMYL